MKSICEYLDEDRKKWADRPYISVKEKGKFITRSFAHVIDDVKALAKSLAAQEISGNIMIYSQNSYQWMVADLAIMGYAGVCVPIDKEWTAFDICNTLSVIDINAIFYEKNKQGIIDEIKKKFSHIHFLCIEDCFSAMLEAGSHMVSALKGNTDMNKTAMILFTSGTTNTPKAIPLTQANLFNNWDTLYQRTPMTTADTTYIFLPLNHVYSGVANFLYTIVSGMQIYLCSDLSLMTQEMLQIRPTIVCIVPLLLNRLYDQANEQLMDMLRAIRFLYCGGSFTDPKIKKFFIDNGVTLLEAYGTTETTSVIALALPEDYNIECNGVVMENLDVRIINPDDNGIGEIIVGGGSVSAGYISRNDTYSQFDDNGFYHTGDLGYLDDKRRLYVKGRKKRMIITANGKNVYVDELEQLLLKNPLIKSATVFEEDFHPVARIYTNLSEEEAQQFLVEVNSKLPKFKQIKKLYIKPETFGGRIK